MVFDTLFAGFLTTIVLSDFLLPDSGRRSTLPQNNPWRIARAQLQDLPSSAQKTFVHAPGLRLRRTANTLTKSRAEHVAFPITQQGLRSQIVISELNTEPARSSVNA